MHQITNTSAAETAMLEVTSISRSAAWAAISSLTAPGRGAPFWPTLEVRPKRVRTLRSSAHAICRLAGSATGAPEPHQKPMIILPRLRFPTAIQQLFEIEQNQ